MAPSFTRKALRNFDWKKNWRWVALGVGLVVVVILIVVLIVLITSSSFTEYQLEGLKIHNEYRATHHTPPLELSADLNSIATKCAKHYVEATDNQKFHPHDCPYKLLKKGGENIGTGSGRDTLDAVKRHCNNWYTKEVSGYDYGSENYDVGHFAQVVWKGSKRLGLGHYGSRKRYAVVGIYDPPGLDLGKWPENVLKP